MIEGHGQTVYRVDMHKILNGFGNPERVEPLLIGASSYKVDPNGALTLNIAGLSYSTLAPGTWVRVTCLGDRDDIEDDDDLTA